jgi:hypothetical protein
MCTISLQSQAWAWPFKTSPSMASQSSWMQGLAFRAESSNKSEMCMVSLQCQAWAWPFETSPSMASQSSWGGWNQLLRMLSRCVLHAAALDLWIRGLCSFLLLEVLSSPVTGAARFWFVNQRPLCLLSAAGLDWSLLLPSSSAACPWPRWANQHKWGIKPTW